MQHPTCTNLHIRTVADANRSVPSNWALRDATLSAHNSLCGRVLHAVRLQLRPLVTRRLDDDERLALRSGCVYVRRTRLHLSRYPAWNRATPMRLEHAIVLQARASD